MPPLRSLVAALALGQSPQAPHVNVPPPPAAPAPPSPSAPAVVQPMAPIVVLGPAPPPNIVFARPPANALDADVYFLRAAPVAPVPCTPAAPVRKRRFGWHEALKNAQTPTG